MFTFLQLRKKKTLHKVGAIIEEKSFAILISMKEGFQNELQLNNFINRSYEKDVLYDTMDLSSLRFWRPAKY